MIAYKGFSHKLTSVMGNGRKEKCSFEPGSTMTETECKTARNGYHCCENPFECLRYYALNGENRFFKVEAAGNIDEDASERIACTKITLLEELTPLKLALEGMRYIIEHPYRERWEQEHGNVRVKKDEAEIREWGIAIARGKDPRVRGPEGSILGLLVEDENGIANCKLFVQKKETAGKWHKLTKDREVVTDEKEAG